MMRRSGELLRTGAERTRSSGVNRFIGGVLVATTVSLFAAGATGLTSARAAERATITSSALPALGIAEMDARGQIPLLSITEAGASVVDAQLTTIFDRAEASYAALVRRNYMPFPESGPGARGVYAVGFSTSLVSASPLLISGLAPVQSITREELESRIGSPIRSRFRRVTA